MSIVNCYDRLFHLSWDERKARQELFRKEPLPVIYRQEESAVRGENIDLTFLYRVRQIVQRTLIFLCFPVYLYQKCQQVYDRIYQSAHQWLGCYLMPAYLKNRNYVVRFIENWNLTKFLMNSSLFSIGLLPTLSQLRPPDTTGLGKLKGGVTNFVLDFAGRRDKKAYTQWQYQRFTIEADATKIDAIFIGRKKVIGKRWPNVKWNPPEQDDPRRIMLYSCSEDELAEGKIYDQELLSLADQIRADIVVWNHPGIGKSSGAVDRQSSAKAAAAMMRFAEEKRGLNADEMVCFGHSNGAAILLEGLQRYTLNSNLRYTFVLRGAFSTLAEATSSYLVKWMIKRLGWNLDNVDSLQKIQAPVILLQMAEVDRYQSLSESSKIIPDGVIEDPDATLAKVVLDQSIKRPGLKVIGIPRWHDETLTSSQVTQLAEDIRDSLYQT